MNILICSCGKHVELVLNIKKSLDENSKIITTAHQKLIPALYAGDRGYVVSDVMSDGYIEEILDICDKEEIGIVLTMLDVETKILSKNRKEFEKRDILLLVPSEKTSEICFDKYMMFCHLRENGIKTINTYKDMESFILAFDKKEIEFPVFVKPNTGRGSVGARRVDSIDELKEIMSSENDLIIQELMRGEDIDVDVYVDAISKKAISIFSKRKIESKIGGTSKSVSFIDMKLEKYVHKLVDTLEFNGPIDIEVFKVDDEYYLTEVNPRFSAAYVQAYSCGVDFVKFMYNNYMKKENDTNVSEYCEGNVMIKYESHLSLSDEAVRDKLRNI